MGNFTERVAQRKMSRRTFLTATAAGTASLALAGCGNVLAPVGADYDAAAVNREGQWITAACWHNCGGRCLNKALVVDGIVVRQKTDDTHPDSPDYPQQRGCLRGRSQQQQVFGADRLKYPMKRKHWEPLTGGDKSLRGNDEWVRISWEEALDYVAAEIKHVKEKYGNRSILMAGWASVMSEMYGAFDAFGGYTAIDDTASQGTYYYASSVLGLTGLDTNSGNDRFDLRKSETIVLYGCNPAWAALGSVCYHLWQAKKAGANYVYVGPSYNATANLLDAKWIRVRPGTDIAFLLAVAYTMLEEDDPVNNQLIDWDFLNRCTVGFDAGHLPADASTDENFKDYVLGQYDSQPKTPEWAAERCGTPVEDIRWYAREMRKDKKVSILHSYAPARCNNADDFPQLFMTVGAMGGHFGKPGHSCGAIFASIGANCGDPLVSLGATGAPFIPNPVDDMIMAPDLWKAVLHGKYTRTSAAMQDPTSVEDREIDIRAIVHCFRNCLQTTVGANKGIEAYRKVDFVLSAAFSLNASAQYSDIVLPISTQWERNSDFIYSYSNREMVLFPSKVTEPLYEAKSDQWIGRELCKRWGLDEAKIYPLTEEQRWFNQIAGATVINELGTGYETLVSISDDDIAQWGVTGTAQQGRADIKALLEKGVYQVERREGDHYGHISYQDYVQDPDQFPLPSKSGKLEIYCQAKADGINAMGRSTIKPYPTYVKALNGYEQSYSDWDKKMKGDYPYQITTPDYLRRAHTVFDNLPWLREAMPNPVYLNAQDAEEKGIKDGDTVLIYNQHGKVLRQANLSHRQMPGYIEIPHGTWMEINQTTGIDSSGSDNILCAPETSGGGVSGYNTNLVNFEKYQGTPLTPDCLWPQRMIKI